MYTFVYLSFLPKFGDFGIGSIAGPLAGAGHFGKGDEYPDSLPVMVDRVEQEYNEAI